MGVGSQPNKTDAASRSTRLWIAAHTRAGLVAGLCLLLASLLARSPIGLPSILWILPLTSALTALPAWVAYRHCSGLALRLAGTWWRCFFWILLDGAAWYWVVASLWLFLISSTYTFQVPTVPSLLISLLANHLIGTLTFLVLGAVIGGLQGLLGLERPLRRRWLVACALGYGAGFALLHALVLVIPLMLSRLPGMGSNVWILMVPMGLLGCMGFWWVRGLITARLVIGRLSS